MKRLCISLCLGFALLALQAQQATNIKWSAGFNESQSFIENKGQFDGRNHLPGSEILYAMDNGALQIFFTKKGITYYTEKKDKNPDRKKGDRSKPKLLKTYEVTHIEWEGANTNTELIGSEITNDYHNYSFINKETNSAFTVEGIRGYKKLVYKNLYPNIDVEYVFHPQGGIKYSVILHPGADASLVKMKYSGNNSLSLNSEGKFIIPTLSGNIVEHEPLTFYADNNSNHVTSAFIYHNNTVSFQLGNYDRNKTILIDPWVQTPVLSNSNCVWECETDSSGNVYIIGGDSPMKLQKYDSLGVLQWTCITPWDTSNSGDWLGTLATDLAGNSYVSNGSIAAMQKINTNGVLQWSVNGGAYDEYWTIAFNCDQTQLIVGGTQLGMSPPTSSKGVIFKINTINGSLIDSVNVSSIRPAPGPWLWDINEVRAITSSANDKFYFLTLDSIGAIASDSFSLSPSPLFKQNSSYNFAYKSENYRPNNGNSGICAIRANDQFVYSQNGTTVHKRSLVNSNIITTAPIPGGRDTSDNFGFNRPENSGIAIDDCGNVYVGSADRVIKYDADLNVLDSVILSFRVFDVAVSDNGNIIVAGATGNSSNSPRTGYVQSINMSACAPFVQLNCCYSGVHSAGPFYLNDTVVTLSSVTPGGIWNGTGITDSLAGIFDPSVAGLGTHTIVYTIGCGSDSTYITVRNLLEVCSIGADSLTVSNGTQPYLWYQADTVTSCNNCINQICGTPPGCEQTIITWTNIATGDSVALPSIFPVKVIDSLSNELILNDTAGLLSCPYTPDILVWPGDANDDLSADIYDIFPIAFNYNGTNGYARDSVSNLWMAHSCQPWAGTYYNGANIGHADCNGDGIIDWNDFDAIIQNYGLTHIRSGAINGRAGEPPLSMTSDKNIYLPGDTVTVEIHAGNANLSLTELYGIAFRLLFDNSVVESGTMQLTYPNSFLGNVSDNLSLTKIFEANGKADGGISKKNLLNANGYGAVAQLQFTAKNTTNLPINTTISFTDYLALNANADSIMFDIQNSNASFTIDAFTGISNNASKYLKVYPNPFNKSVTIEYELNENSDVSLKIYDVLGRILLENPVSVQSNGVYKVQFENTSISNGIFFVEFIINGEKIIKKIVQL